MRELELQGFIAEQVWRFAKTMPQWPHWYCLHSKTPDPAVFPRFVRHIREAGYLAEFRPVDRAAWAQRRYLDVGPFHYWTMDDDERSVTLINRAEHPNVAVRCRTPATGNPAEAADGGGAP